MAKETKADIATRARKIIKEKLHGILGTQSKSNPGYPFGSLVQYAFDSQGKLILLISDLAEHTKNIHQNNKVSITAMEDKEYVQTAGRVTILGQANQITDSDVIGRYYRFFPKSENYHKTHNFDFYRIDVERVRFIGGFGDINWISQDNFCQLNPFSKEEETSAIDHMNEDHQSALYHYYCKAQGKLINADAQLQLVAFDAEGMWIRQGKRDVLQHILFNRPVATMMELRQMLVAMRELKTA